jgi:hypothetical protein
MPLSACEPSDILIPHYCWSTVIPPRELNQGCEEGGHRTPSSVLWVQAAVFVMEEHCIPHRFLLFCSTLVTLLCHLVAWIPPSALPSCPRNRMPSALWQTDNIRVNPFSLFAGCDCPLVWTFKIKPRFHHMLLTSDKTLASYDCGIRTCCIVADIRWNLPTWGVAGAYVQFRDLIVFRELHMIVRLGIVWTVNIK